MKNNLNYYTHYANSHNHWKFKLLRSKYGWAGEGRFWALNNMIADSDQCTLNLARKNIKATVANDLNFTLQELDEFITFLVQDAELIKVIGHLYYTENVRDDYQKVLKEREAARARKIKSSSELLKNSSKLFSISPERNNRDRYRER